MMPDNKTSWPAVPAPLIGGRASPLVTPSFDVTDGPVDFSDNSQGITAKVWYCEVRPDGVWAWNDDIVPVQLIAETGVTECSLAFDGNASWCLAYVKGGVSYFSWYDQSIPDRVTITLNGKTPRVIMDDPRQEDAAVADVLVFYVRDGSGYQLRQRDRFLTEYGAFFTNDDGVPAVVDSLKKVARNQQFRLEFVTMAQP